MKQRRVGTFSRALGHRGHGLMLDRSVPCPNCGRPMGFEYRAVEPDVCQLWRHMNECPGSLVEPRTVDDCFRRTTSRLHQLEYEVRELELVRRQAQRALERRHHAQ